MTGYPPGDLLLKPAFIARGVIERTHDLLPHKGHDGRRGALQARPRPLQRRRRAARRRVREQQRKIWLPNYGVFDEKRYSPQPPETCGVFARGELQFGVNVCGDIWVEAAPTEDRVARGARS